MLLNQLTILKASKGLKNKEFSSLELTQAVFDEIKKSDGAIHAYLSLNEEGALARAGEIDKKIAANESLPILAGVPVAIKDNILIEGLRCTAGSKILENYVAPYDASVIKKLKEAGAVFLGKTNMDEFAMGSSTENSAFGPTKNPCDLERVPGGSSGGSVAAVAANEAIYALGSDTGGSIRQPASFCGVVGLKPTYGAVSRFGLMAMASSFDQIGPVAKNVEDCRVIFEAIKGKDLLDSTSINLSTSDVDTTSDVKNLKIGIPKEYFAKGIDAEVEEAVKQAIKKLQDAGAKVEEVSLPHSEYALACYYIIMASEVSANLARYDGIKYGYSAINDSLFSVKNLLDNYLKTRQHGFGAEVRRRIMLGTYSLSSGYYDAYYLKAQKVRALIKKDFDEAFEKVDVILTPTSPTPAFKIGEKIEDPVKMYLSDVYTVPINLAGVPALSMPCGLVGRLPVGLQIIGPQFGEELIFEAGLALEQLLD
ncbi:MAG: Asp-tRNA(Asn)/Glu-tRNA(Gln) amidotransferase subunit GatA [Candidatus Portnoybacteria bacterium]|nr:Asp-tRNA(Asn)/Glu-tRNA(Gln) amidotransferase subunit GatA [Candidatus Portnoybacteria bacterium]